MLPLLLLQLPPLLPPQPLLLMLLLLVMPALAGNVLSSRPLLKLRQVLHCVIFFLARVALHFIFCEGWIHLSMPRRK